MDASPLIMTNCGFPEAFATRICDGIGELVVSIDDVPLPYSTPPAVNAEVPVPPYVTWTGVLKLMLTSDDKLPPPVNPGPAKIDLDCKTTGVPP